MGYRACITFWYFMYHIPVISHKNLNFSLKHLLFQKIPLSKYFLLNANEINEINSSFEEKTIGTKIRIR